jgi:uncharacterized membrane protein
MTLPRPRYDFVGLAFAVVFFCCSLTPSLLPRGWLFQGLLAGIAAAIGYGVGLLLYALVRWIFRWRRWQPTGRRPWLWLAAVAGVVIVVFLVLGSQWQRQIHDLVGMSEPPNVSYLGVLTVAALLFAGLVGIGRLLRGAARWLTRLLSRRIPAMVARLAAVVIVTLLAFGFLNGVLIDGFFSVTDSAFKKVNGETQPGVQAPVDLERSGGPGSLVSWASLGNQGRTFVTGGPTDAELAAFGGPSPAHPIRVYTGLDSAPTTEERAALAVRELERTGAFARTVLCVITTTGTGWVDAKAVDPLEYLYHGDTALVAMQYSYLPSWLSFLVDKDRAREAGRELFDQVYAAWSALPAGSRPRLVAFGESLGSFGVESAFSGAADMRARTDGMLLVGPPNRNTLWREFTAERDPGTPEIRPVYASGETVRFSANPADLDEQPATAWRQPRVAYLQHASDPIVWWTPKLLLQRPDWLEEPRGADVSSHVRWFPFVTFWQVTADMTFSTGVPAGHGHNYGGSAVAAWADILPPPGWTPERTAALTKIIEAEPS